MKFQLEKEVIWECGKSVTKYWVKVDDKYVELTHDEDRALELYENVKANYIGSSKQILKEEEIQLG